MIGHGHHIHLYQSLIWDLLSIANIFIKLSCSYEGLVLRSLLAAIDHNHHLCRKQAQNAKGEDIYSRRWSKRAKRWKVVIVKEEKKYSYLPVLCAHVLKILDSGSAQPVTYVHNPRNVAPTIAKIPAPSTSELVKDYISRF